MKFVYALMGASVLMIALGLYLISQQQGPVQDSVADPTEPPSREIGLIPALPEQERDDTIPELETDAEPGSDTWCEEMMRLANDRWSHEDSQTFADHCIYE